MLTTRPYGSFIRCPASRPCSLKGQGSFPTYGSSSRKVAHTVAPHVRNMMPSNTRIGYISLTPFMDLSEYQNRSFPGRSIL